MTSTLPISNLQTDAQKVNERQAEHLKRVTATIDLRDLKVGHRIFEWDIKEGIIQPAIIVEKTVAIGARRTYKDYIEFETRPNCKYTPALNAQNAEKRLKKQLGIK